MIFKLETCRRTKYNGVLRAIKKFVFVGFFFFLRQMKTESTLYIICQQNSQSFRRLQWIDSKIGFSRDRTFLSSFASSLTQLSQKIVSKYHFNLAYEKASGHEGENKFTVILKKYTYTPCCVLFQSFWLFFWQ